MWTPSNSMRLGENSEKIIIYSIKIVVVFAIVFMGVLKLQND